jgi:putative OPT family oligopeptide transporter
VRFIGAGVIGVAALWSLFRIIGPISKGIRSAMAASKARSAGTELPLTERDLPIGIVGGTIVAMLVPIAGLLWYFASGTAIETGIGPTIFGSLIYVVVIGAVIACVCGYMAGLIGASNSPVSGVGILAVIGASVLLVMVYGHGGNPEQTKALVAYALFTTAIVFSIATISNDNLQDLKTGQLVGATPWRQQLALIYGVIFGSLVIPPVLDLLNKAFGFAGAPGAGENALAAPQAALISALAKGVLGGDIQWDLIGWGRRSASCHRDRRGVARGQEAAPAPAVRGHGHLPADGAHAPHPGRRLHRPLLREVGRRQKNPEFVKRMGVLGATGFIVGESLFRRGLRRRRGRVGQRFAAWRWSASSFEKPGIIIGLLAFTGIIVWLYRSARRIQPDGLSSAVGQRGARFYQPSGPVGGVGEDLTFASRLRLRRDFMSRL